MFIYVLYCIYLIHIRINLCINIIFLTYRQIVFAKNVRQYRYTLQICGVSNHFKSKSIMYSKDCILSTVKYFNISILSLMLASSQMICTSQICLFISINLCLPHDRICPHSSLLCPWFRIGSDFFWEYGFYCETLIQNGNITI